VRPSSPWIHARRIGLEEEKSTRELREKNKKERKKKKISEKNKGF